MGNEDLTIAAKAALELFRLAGMEHRGTVYTTIAYDSNLGNIIKTLKENQTVSAVAPAIDYLLHIPMLDGGAGSSFPEKPNKTDIRDVIDFLMWMGDETAIPALTRIANTHRTIRFAEPNDGWGTEPNHDERANAERAIRVIKAIRAKGFDACYNCNGRKKVKCSTCDGTGKIEIIETKKGIFRAKEIRHINTCWKCKGTSYQVCDICKGLGKQLPKM